MSQNINLVDNAMGRNRTDLARQIMITIQNFTHGRPMPQAEVIATLAFCVGAGIGNQPKNVDKGVLMRLAGKMVAEGEDVASRDVHTQLIDIKAIKLS